MGITGKELAKKLNLSEAAVSMALNGKPGVSTETRNLIIQTANEFSYDFSKLRMENTKNKVISFIIYHKHGVIVKDSPFSSKLTERVSDYCLEKGYKAIIRHIFHEMDVQAQLNEIIIADECSGIILLGSEMKKRIFFLLRVFILHVYS